AKEFWRRWLAIATTTVAEAMLAPLDPNELDVPSAPDDGDGPLRPTDPSEIHERDVKAEYGPAVGTYLLAAQELRELTRTFDFRLGSAERNSMAAHDWDGIARLCVRAREELRKVVRAYL